MAKKKPPEEKPHLDEILFNKVCDQIATSSKGLSKICTELKVTRSTFYEYLKNSKAAQDTYVRAREDQADFLADEMLEIADKIQEGETVTEKPTGVEITKADMLGHRRLQIDTRKWLASKLKAKKYGDKLDVTSDGEKLTTYSIGFKRQDDEGKTND